MVLLFSSATSQRIWSAFIPYVQLFIKSDASITSYVPSRALVGLVRGARSMAFAAQAQFALIFLSKSYLEKYKQGAKAQDGNIWSEINVLLKRVREGSVCVRFLTPDGFDNVKNYGEFPLAELVGHKQSSICETEIPSMSSAIRSMTATMLAEIINQILA